MCVVDFDISDNIFIPYADRRLLCPLFAQLHVLYMSLFMPRTFKYIFCFDVCRFYCAVSLYICDAPHETP